VSKCRLEYFLFYLSLLEPKVSWISSVRRSFQREMESSDVIIGSVWQGQLFDARKIHFRIADAAQEPCLEQRIH
jgi:hypothetical protein